MKTLKTTKTTIHRSTAEQSFDKALQFLRTIGTDPTIRTAMQETGFDDADLKQGWALVLKASSAPPPATKFTPDAGPVADATKSIEAWRSTMFLRGHAALRRLHPEQDAFVFGDVASGTGSAAVVAVSVFLDRLDALESSSERKGSRKADHAAMATLERRGVTKDARKQARHLVHIVETTTAPTVVPVVAPPTDARMEALTDLYAWIQDWSDCARAVITRRDQLIRLGIGKRHARVAATPVPPPAPASAPVVQQLSNGSINGALMLPAHNADHS
jgi:hypothetical protein